MEKIKESILSDAIKTCIDNEKKMIVYRRWIVFLSITCAMLTLLLIVR